MLGGSGTVEEIEEKAFQIMELSDEAVEMPHSKKSNQSEVAYRLAWSRTYLKKYGLLHNSARGVWALAKDPDDIAMVDEREVVKRVRDLFYQNKSDPIDTDAEVLEQEIDTPDEAQHWRSKLLELLLSLEPDAFERLAQRFLRESGFVQVEVTGRSGDGGIDGKGIIRMSGVLSFHMIFQCKNIREALAQGI